MKASDPLSVANAGLVLLNPFLPHFFAQLGVLTDDGKGKPHFADNKALSRAVHLLQYLVDERCDRPAHELVLNKVLCGATASIPIAAAIVPSEEERALCTALLGAVLANWRILRDASPASLRETFLQREGRLTHNAKGWALNVQRKTIDILVDQIPWTFAILYPRWFDEALYVTW